MICLSLIFIAAPIRLLSFAQLGKDFTFRLAKPKKLVTSGLYTFVQHPRYAAGVVVFLANTLLLLRVDGIVGCWLPDWVVHWGGVKLVEAVGIVGLLGFSSWGMGIRVMEEEKMFKEEFRKEWETYHQKTKRFVPGLF
jgi:protein-S-isoprenylcysteine O-methyltransferase Ste14